MGGVISSLRSKPSRRIAPENKANPSVPAGRAGQAVKTRESKAQSSADPRLNERKASVQVARGGVAAAARPVSSEAFKTSFAARFRPLWEQPGATGRPQLETGMVAWARTPEANVPPKTFVDTLIAHQAVLGASELVALTRGFCRARPEDLDAVIEAAMKSAPPWTDRVDVLMPILTGALSTFKPDAASAKDRLQQQIDHATTFLRFVDVRRQFSYGSALLGALIHAEGVEQISLMDYSRICEALFPLRKYSEQDGEVFLRCVPVNHGNRRMALLHQSYERFHVARTPQRPESKRPDDSKEPGAGAAVPPQVQQWIEANPRQAAELLANSPHSKAQVPPGRQKSSD